MTILVITMKESGRARMTDNEIVKALECCFARQAPDCKNCPNENTCSEVEIIDEIIELINRKNAEIERLLQKLQNPVVAENAITALREKCVEHQDFHRGDDGVFRAYISIEDLDRIIDEM